MHIACYILRATNTHPDYVLLIAFPLQRLLHDRASMLCHSTSLSCSSWDEPLILENRELPTREK